MKKFINLLPPDQQKQIRLARLNSEILRFGVWLILSFLAFSSVLFVSLIILQTRLADLDEAAAGQTRVLNEIKETAVLKEAQAYNEHLKNFQNLAAVHEKWSAILLEIARKLPPDMTIDTLAINRSDKRVELAGRAGSRASVLEYRQNLLEGRQVVNINFPLSNLEKARDVRWKYRFFVNPALLK